MADQHPFLGEAARRSGGPGWSGFGRGQGHQLGHLDDVFAYTGDRAGVRRWARERGWVSAPAGEVPPVVAEVLAGAPVPVGPEHAAVDVWTGDHGGWAAAAFDVVVRTASGDVPDWAVTAVGRPREAGPFRLHPRRLAAFIRSDDGPRVTLSDGELAGRWVATGGDCVAGLLEAPVARAALLGTDDGDEVWATRTALAALRPDGHRPELLDHHLTLLAALAEAES